MGKLELEPRTHRARRTVVWVAGGLIAASAAAFLIVRLPRLKSEQSLDGAVLIADADPRKQLPLPGVEITAELGGEPARAVSSSSGFFHLVWKTRIWRNEEVTLGFRRAGYQPLDVTFPFGDELFIARMSPAPAAKAQEAPAREIPVKDIRVRYAVNTTTTVNVGSTAKVFQVINKGGVPCNGRPPCSPDGIWKAANGALSLDAGEGHEFRNARVSCIAGPCPFTKIESDAFARGGRTINVTVRAWSDTVTFLLEAEVAHTTATDAIRRAYPSIFGRAMSFTLPPTGQGPSIEAEVDGADIVYPLGPELNLSWASCTLQVASDGTKLYSCEAKPGYRLE